MIDIGVVCEGSHDFIIIKEIVSKALRPAEVRCVPIQPIVDATLLQVGTGGFSEVKIWCLQNRGRKFFDQIKPGIFANSQVFDFIIVHLDGDVLEKSNWFSATQVASGTGSVTNRISIIEQWIHNAIAYSGSDELVSAIPVLSTDGWVLAGVRPTRNFELQHCKKRLERYLKKFFGEHKASSLARVMPHCASNVTAARANNLSLDHFVGQLP